MSKKEDRKILDSDADGLSDEEEKALGTNPYDQDTDHDGLGDYQEVNVYKTNPLNQDTDCDGVGDGAEVKIGRNPRGRGMLTDLFIPNKCNNYRPKALHPKRLAFYALSSVTIKAITVAFLMSFPIQAWLSPNVLYEQSQKIINLTNNIRSGLNLPILKENSTLNQAALNKAQDMLVNEYFAHVGPDSRSLKNWLFDSNYAFRVAGENLAIGFNDADAVINAWVNSQTHYANIIDPDYTEIGVGAVSGDYKGYETTLIAQYFGDPPQVLAAIEVPEPVVEAEKEAYDAKIDEKPVEKPEEIIKPEEVQAEDVKTDEKPVEKPEEIVLEENPPIKDIEDLTGEQEAVLSVPILSYPENNSFLNSTDVVLKILAPGADKVAIFDNGVKIKEISIETELFEEKLSLGDGEHKLKIYSSVGDKEAFSMTYKINIDTLLPVIDHEKTEVLVNQPSDDQGVVIKVSSYLSSDASSANFNFDNYQIKLERDYTDENKWSGSTIISDKTYDDLFNPAVMASMTVSDQAGNTLVQDVSWDNIVPVENSAVDQYMFLKNNPSEYIKPLFDFSSIYFKIILAVSVVALMLCVFVEIKKQHYPTILSSIGLIILMSLLTIF